jgi:crotonobetainyl-CoA:carnitine CoA-transferase CaiB-like acyl-CoA transferase
MPAATESMPLQGLRVVDVTDDSGRFATRLLTEMGADVVRITANGSPGQPMRDERAARRGGVLDWWYDGGKRRRLLNLETPADREEYRRLAALADLIVETERPGRLHELGIDHPQLLTSSPRLCQVSITPFGRTGPRRHWVTSDLVSAALGGSLSVTGLPERPLNLWGRQAFNYAGFMAAQCALAAVLAARADGHGRHVDVSIHETVSGSIENPLMQWLFDDLLPLPKLAERQGALHWLRAYDLAECRSGYLMITPTPDSARLIEWLIEDGIDEARAWQHMETTEAVDHIDDIMAAVRRWVRRYDARELWWEAQSRHVAFGGVLDVPAVAAIPQFGHRHFFAAAQANGTSVQQPAHLVRFSDAPAPAPRPPAADDTALEDILAAWQRETPRAQPPAPANGQKPRPLEGVRIADFTWVLAGPFATRMLGDLGADVIRIQNEERSTLVNRPDYPYYFVWNRSKRSATLNMKHPKALATVRKLLEHCDVLIENYSAGVLDAWGLDWETVHAWNPRLVYVTMSGCGHDGPWSHVISYAPTVHAVCGITHLTNFADRGDVGPGYSLNDHLAGFAAAATTLAALFARARTGRGQKIDMAQLEVGSYAIGPALIDHFANARDAQPHGNVDGLQDHVPNEVYRCRDGFVAVSVTNAAQWQSLVRLLDDARLADPAWQDEATRASHRREIDAAIAAWMSRRDAEDAMGTLQTAGVPAGKVQHIGELIETDEQHRARAFWRPVSHDFFGDRLTDTFPALWDGERPPVERLAPAYLGEHNFQVYGELAGMDEQEIAEGMADGLFS